MSIAPRVHAVHLATAHHFSKTPQDAIQLIAGEGVQGDCHRGHTVKHRSRVRRDPTQPNLRQVHLMHQELLLSLSTQGFPVVPGCLGENITTVGLDLLALPRQTRLKLGPDAEIEITGLRNPCVQLDHFAPGLQAAVLDRDSQGQLIRKAGIMAIVIRGGEVQPGFSIEVLLPPEPPQNLEPV